MTLIRTILADTAAVNVTDESPYLSSGWVTWFSESQFVTAKQEVAAGDCYHLTSLYGASVTLPFYGILYPSQVSEAIF